MSRFSVLVKNKSVRTALPVAALALSGELHGAGESKSHLKESVESSEISSPTLLDVSSVTVSKPTVTVYVQEWTEELEKRFHVLAKKDALSKATPLEVVELDQMEHLRNRLKSPMTFDEIVWQLQHEEATQKLLAAMQDYLKFCAGPGWAGAKRNC